MPTNDFLPIDFAVTPRFDLFYSLYTLTGSTSTKLNAWKERALGRVPRDFLRVSKRVAPVPLFWPLLADSIQGTPGELTFEEIIEALRALPGEKLRENLLSGIFSDRDSVDALLEKRRTLRQILSDENTGNEALLTALGLRPYAAGSDATNAISSLLGDADSYRDELILVLQRYWQTGFRRDWQTLEPQLRAAVFRMKDLHERAGLTELAANLNLPVVIDASDQRVQSKTRTVAKFGQIDRCYVIPSPFNVGRWWAKYVTESGRVRLYFPITSPDVSPNEAVPVRRADEVQKSNAPVSTIDAELVFRALGDTTRYAIASIIATEPATSADLARRLNVSKPTITHHIQALRGAELILSESHGGATKLSLNADTLRRVSDAAVDQLFSPRVDRELTTTRKRRK